MRETPRGRTVGAAAAVVLGMTAPFAAAQVECAPGDLPEGEPLCHDGSVDDYDGGCGAAVPWFRPVACGTTTCGTSGTFLLEGATVRDTDWYEVVHPGGALTYVAIAEFPVQIAVIDAGSVDCTDFEIVGWASADAGALAAVHLPAAPLGTYWLWFAPGIFEGVSCGASYRATVTCGAACPADLDGSGDVGFADLLALLGAWGPCAACAADLDGGGAVDFADLLALLGAWGPCGA